LLGKRLRVLWYLTEDRAEVSSGVPGLSGSDFDRLRRTAASRAGIERGLQGLAGSSGGEEHGGRAETAAWTFLLGFCRSIEHARPVVCS